MLKVHIVNADDIRRAGLPHLYRRSNSQPVIVPGTDQDLPGTEEVPIQDAEAVIIKAHVGFLMGVHPVTLAIEKLARLVEYHGLDPKRVVILDVWSGGELPLMLPQEGEYMCSLLSKMEASVGRLSSTQKQAAFLTERAKFYEMTAQFRFIRRHFNSFELRELGDRALSIPDIDPSEDLFVEGEPKFGVDISVRYGRGGRHLACAQEIQRWHKKCAVFAPSRGLYDDYVYRMAEQTAHTHVAVDAKQTEAAQAALKENARKQMFAAEVKPESGIESEMAEAYARARCVLVVEEIAGVAPRSLYRAMSAARPVVWCGSEFPKLPSFVDTTGWILRIKDGDLKNIGHLTRLWLREGDDKRIIEMGAKAREQWKLACDWQNRLADLLKPSTI